MHHEPKSLRSILEAAAPLGGMLTFKPMFGGIMVYAEGKPFVSLSNVGIALKLDAASRQALLSIEGAKPLQYEPDGPPSKSYVTVPEDMHQDIQVLSSWVARSAAFVLEASAKPRPKTKRPL